MFCDSFVHFFLCAMLLIIWSNLQTYELVLCIMLISDDTFTYKLCSKSACPLQGLFLEELELDDAKYSYFLLGNNLLA